MDFGASLSGYKAMLGTESENEGVLYYVGVKNYNYEGKYFMIQSAK